MGSVWASLCFCALSPSVRAQEAPEPSSEEETPAPTPDSPPAPARLEITPPEVEERADAVYPEAAFEEGREATVVLLVTVDAEGRVSEASVAESGGPAFDAAALDAIAGWRFAPARREGTPVASRIRVPFAFRMPALAVAAEETTPSAQAAGRGQAAEEAAEPAASRSPTAEDEAPLEVVVEGRRQLRTEDRSASDFELDREVIEAAPRQEGAEVLRSAPGLYLGRGEGLAVAHNYVLRGFDAEHGQDIEFRVGGLPINMRSHIHGQGYADIGFLIADVVQGLHVSEGVYDPRQGDFAVAGSIDVSLGVSEANRGVRLRSGYGAFNTFEELAMWAPREASEESFGAVRYVHTDGFGQNRAGQSGSGIFQHRFGTGDTTFRAIGIVHAARSKLAGVVRQDDVDAGRVCYYCVYPYPTAQAQNAMAGRVLVGLFADHQNDAGANGQLGVYLGYDDFRIQRNFTGFIEQSQTLSRVAGRGDLIEQQNRTLSVGLTGRYRSAPLRPTGWAHGTVELGVDGRVDVIDQAQNLLDAAVRNQTWDRRVDAGVRAMDIGLYGDLDWRLTDYVRARLGFRGDLLSYDVDDRLGNYAPLTRPHDSYVVGFRRSALGLAFGPRASFEVAPLSWLAVVAAYGEGYRSPQARTLEDGEDAPFTKVRSADLGMRFDWGAPLQLTVGGYYTHLSDDVIFDAAEARLERVGATQRMGAVVTATTRPVDWLLGSASFTFVDATLLQPPPATAEEPDPPFVEGQSLAFVPPVVVRVDLAARRELAQAFGRALSGRIGVGLSYMSPRPLPYGTLSNPVVLLDGSAELDWGPLALTFSVFNALGSQYAAVPYELASDWNPTDGVRPRTPTRHLSAGAPLSWMLSLGITL